MDCGTCGNYDHGKGKNACLKCKKYLYLILKSGRRSPIVFERIPEAIYDNIADPDIDERMPVLIEGMRKLPMELSMVMMGYYILDIRQRELSQFLNISESTINRRLIESVNELKNIIRNKYK
jgi:DNA-directed RNA polymerase specialized sigma subunit